GRLAIRPLNLRLHQFRRDCTYNAPGHLILQLENVFEPTAEAISPQVRSGDSVDKLPSDSHPVRSLADAAFKHVPHSQFAAGRLHVYRPTFVREARIAPDNKQVVEPRKGGDDLSRHAISKILLLRIAA